MSGDNAQLRSFFTSHGLPWNTAISKSLADGGYDAIELLKLLEEDEWDALFANEKVAKRRLAKVVYEELKSTGAVDSSNCAVIAIPSTSSSASRVGNNTSSSSSRPRKSLSFLNPFASISRTSSIGSQSNNNRYQSPRRSSSLSSYGSQEGGSITGPRRSSATSKTNTRLLMFGALALIFVLNTLRFGNNHIFDTSSLSESLAIAPEENGSKNNGGAASSSNANSTSQGAPSSATNNAKKAPPRVVLKCTPEQLAIIKRQLPPDDCIKHQREPWRQRCAMSYATRCPDSTWLEKYYTKLHNANRQTSTDRPPPPFLAIFIGCNKGFDGINAMRMGSGNPVFDKDKWKDALTQRGKVELKTDVCNQATLPQFELPANSTDYMKAAIQVKSGSIDKDGSTSTDTISTFPHQVHCIEPMPSTYNALERAAYETRYEKKGFIVTNAAMSKEDGVIPFARGGGREGRTIGVENKGISTSNCDTAGDKSLCENVTMYSLDSYMDKFIPRNTAINYLSIDVEGWDWEVILGGEKRALAWVHYLEFEYNWVKPWKEQSLSQAIEYLDEFGFTCYWAGFNNTIWRITDCWLPHYDVHIWSNVACVNRNFDKAREIADDMEKMFLETLDKGDLNIRDFEHRFQRKADS